MASEPKAPKPVSTARVTLTLEIEVESTWGDDCTVGQVYKQAQDGAMGTISQMVAASGVNKYRERVRVIGKSKIDAVIAPRG